MRELKFQVYKAIAGWLLIIASVKNFCSSQKYIFYMAKKKCSDIGNIGNKSTDTDIVILGPIYQYPISILVHLYLMAHESEHVSSSQSLSGQSRPIKFTTSTKLKHQEKKTEKRSRNLDSGYHKQPK